MILSFSYPFCSLHQSSFVSVITVRQNLILRFPPLGLVSHFLSFFTFLSSAPLLTLPDFTSASFLHLPVFVSLCGLCFSAAVRVSRTEEESVRFCPPLSLTAPYPNAESKQLLPIPGNIRDRKRLVFLFFSPFTLPLSPLLVETINHNGRFR